MAESTFTPIEPNPYIVGNPVRNPKMFFGRSAEFRLVRKHFVESPYGMLFVFCGERRSGKTSILFQIRDGRLGEGFLPVLIDMQSMVIATEADFFRKITNEIFGTLSDRSARLKIPDYDASKPSAVFLEFMRDLSAAYPEKRPVLLIDEYELMEDKVDEGRLTKDVFDTFAHLMENHKVFFVFTGSQHLEQRGHNVWRILARSHHKRISYLDKSDAVHLITGPVEGRVDYEGETVERICRLAAGQPFYTQWVCQNVVDHLNEHHTYKVNDETVSAVIKMLVQNPAPEMTRLWKDLQTDEKITLALLAEVLSDADDFARPEQLAEYAKANYPIDIDLPRIARSAAELFRNELLSIPADDEKSGHSFRMDLWRLWIRRSHTVWQVIHEEDIPVLKRWHERWRVPLIAAAAVLPLLIWGVSLVTRPEIVDQRVTSVIPPRATASVSLVATPEDAMIFVNGQLRGTGRYENSGLDPDRAYEFRVKAAGYHDSTVTAQVPADSSRELLVSLRLKKGSIRIVSTPPGAEVRLAGDLKGKTPLSVRDLPTTSPYSFAVSLPGWDGQTKTIRAIADSTLTAQFRLRRTEHEIYVSTSPEGASIAIDGVFADYSPAQVRMTEADHHLSVDLDGYSAVDTSLTIAGGAPLHFVLRALPPGILVVRGDKIASIYIDGALVIENVQNSNERSVHPGLHDVRVVPVLGDEIEATVEVPSGQITKFDYSDGTISRQAASGGRARSGGETRSGERR